MSGFVQLTLGREKFLLRQEEVIALEPAIDINQAKKVGGSIGTITREDGEAIPVYNLTSNLELSSNFPESRGICVCLCYGNIQFGIICDDVDKSVPLEFTFYMVPECMRTETCPVKNLAVSGNKVISIISTEAISRFLPIPDREVPDLLDTMTTGRKL